MQNNLALMNREFNMEVGGIEPPSPCMRCAHLQVYLVNALSGTGAQTSTRSAPYSDLVSLIGTGPPVR